MIINIYINVLFNVVIYHFIYNIFSLDDHYNKRIYLIKILLEKNFMRKT